MSSKALSNLLENQTGTCRTDLQGSSFRPGICVSHKIETIPHSPLSSGKEGPSNLIYIVNKRLPFPLGDP